MNSESLLVAQTRLLAVSVGRLPQLTVLTPGTTWLCDPKGDGLQTELHCRRCPPAQLRREVPLLRARTSLPIEPCTWPSETDRRATTVQSGGEGMRCLGVWHGVGDLV